MSDMNAKEEAHYAVNLARSEIDSTAERVAVCQKHLDIAKKKFRESINDFAKAVRHQEAIKQQEMKK